MNENPAKAARKAALLVLGRRDYPAAKLLQKLLDKGFDPDTAQETVEWCRERGYLDDLKLALRICEQKTAAGYGWYRIAADLRNKGFDAETIREAGETLREPSEEDEAAKERLVALCRKLRKGDEWNHKEKARVSAALSRRGFGWSEIRSALEQVTEEDTGW